MSPATATVLVSRAGAGRTVWLHEAGSGMTVINESAFDVRHFRTWKLPRMLACEKTLLSKVSRFCEEAGSAVARVGEPVAARVCISQYVTAGSRLQAAMS